MIPDRLPDALREPIRKFPAGALQFEVGIQTLSDEVAARISRRQDNSKIAQNLKFLRDETGVHVHADLIVGLPGEDVATFARGFDWLVALRPQEIQVGLLKRLRGTPIVRHNEEFAMIYSPHAPYEILQTREIDFATMQRMRRFARYWDLVANSGNFVYTIGLLLAGEGGAFETLLRFSDWLFDSLRQTHAISLSVLAERLFEFLTSMCSRTREEVARAMWQDFQRLGRSDRPEFLLPYLADADFRTHCAAARPRKGSIRQARHAKL